MNEENVEQRDEVAHSHFVAAWAAFKSGDWWEALSRIDEAIELTSDSTAKSVYLATKGGFLNRTDSCDRAIPFCEQAVELEPKNYHAWGQAGLAFLKLGKYEDAARCFNEVANLQPTCAAYTLLAKSQLAFDPASALQNAEKALKIEPSWHEALTLRMLADRRINELEEN